MNDSDPGKPQCDCLNHCGDDNRVRAGTVRKCADHDQVQHAIWQQRTALQIAGGITRALVDVVDERRGQQMREGWTLAHDDEHEHGELALAAACYAAHTFSGTTLGVYERTPRGFERYPIVGVAQELVQRMWPWAREWWKPKTRRHNLVRAAALLLAEIERIDREASSNPAGGRP